MFDRAQWARIWGNVIVVCAGILFAALVFRLDAVTSVLGSLMRLLFPFFMGFVVAFLIEPPVTFVENLLIIRLCRKRDRQKLCRALSLLIVYALMLLLVATFVAVVLPQLFLSVRSLIFSISNFIRNHADEISRFLSDFNITGASSENVLITWDDLMKKALEFSGVALREIVNMSVSVSSTLVQIFLGLIISVYMVYDRERFLAQGRKAASAFLPRQRVELLAHWVRKSHKIFAGFITGKLIETVVVGFLCYIGMLIFRMEYAVLISVIVGVTNMVPFFGAFVGAVIGILILLIVNPVSAFWFLIFILVLQQLDGNVIGPRILGDAIGISPFWIMLAILLGGGLFGVTGMFLSIPVFALLYAIAQAVIDARLIQRGLPTGIAQYDARNRLPREHK